MADNFGLAESLNNAVAAVAPIIGVSIGNPADRLTWSVTFTGAATPAQKSAAAAIVAAFDPTPVPLTLDQIYDRELLNSSVLKALVLAINDGSLTVGGNKTGPQLKAVIKAKM